MNHLRGIQSAAKDIGLWFLVVSGIWLALLGACELAEDLGKLIGAWLVV
jgi:hypothetical protein